MEITQRQIETIRPYEKNAKAHSEAQVKQIARSIEEFGFNQPIVVDAEGVVVVGHGRLEAAKLLGLTIVPILELNLSPEQAKAYRLADNRLNESNWNFDILIEELKELEVIGMDIELSGFDLGFIQDNFNYRNTNTELDMSEGDDDKKDQDLVKKKNSCPNCGYEL